MTITERPVAAEHVPMTPLRKTALAAGVLYLLSFVSIPTLVLYTSVRGANYVTGPGPDTPVIVGGILEMIVALAGIGTAVALYPVVKRQNRGMALGFVGTRTLEAATIVVGVASLMSIVTLRRADESERAGEQDSAPAAGPHPLWRRRGGVRAHLLLLLGLGPDLLGLLRLGRTRSVPRLR